MKQHIPNGLVRVITKVLMKQGGLGDFDYEFVEQDALAIISKLNRLGYTIKKEPNNE